MSMHDDHRHGGHHHHEGHDHAHDVPVANMEDGEESHYFDHIYLAHGHDENARKTMWVVWLTAATMVVEIVFGWLTGSMALLADGFHMATHAGALAVAAAAYGYARRHARNPRYTFGTGKVGDLSGFASALILAFTALFIAVESTMRFFEPVKVAFGEATLVAVIGLIINLISAFLLGHDHSHDHGHSHDHDHKPGHADNNLRAAYVHVLTDALTSVLAIVALLAGRYMGWWWLDPAVGLLGAVVIARWAWGLMQDTAAILLDTAEPALMARIKRLAEAEGATIHDLHVWRIGPHAHAAIISLAPGADVAAVRRQVHALPRMEHVTVECG
ncbi:MULTISPECIES: CDF family Co(II)/Ni(II) efflux transporter DmeF [unclassified Sphingobium]|uniref:CDF family Co(II)/Ni(II) efflux transporter DmeF n=1 Tax=unclassified Sphingobium TaxID=2611147 RepID=UPI00076FF564|nr:MULTISPECIES: CDF family Co(II)/Ni(II) efflux transporter DmeF [unclassified Sphingobium]AMK25011.1 CDF-family cation efflux system protein [Sphingobium sp. TKS]NML90515.1 CDF family Co(II)/Ni(II) efflux transporter DmeF [Sphingobium sp. TB-6]